MSNIKRATPRFRVAEYADGRFWIMVEQSGGDDLTVFEKVIGFDLRPGTSFEEAKVISAYLNWNLPVITETSVEAPATAKLHAEPIIKSI